MELTSSAFEFNALIPHHYTADGEGVSPPLSWTDVPADVAQFALIVDDPDAPRDEPFVHWVLYMIPPDADHLPGHVPGRPELDRPSGARQGVNDFGKIGYGGPAPPRGHGVHRYHFRLYALDTALRLGSGMTKHQLAAAMEDHILDEAELVGIYER